MVINVKEVINVIKSNLLIKSLIGIFVAFLLYTILKIVIRKFIKTGKGTYEVKKRNTIIKLLENIIKYIIFIILILYIMEINGIDTKSLIAGIGVAGVVIGLALQDLLKDVISGLSIMLDNYFVIGDIVEFDGFTGEVVEFGLKSTKIQAFSGERYTIANRNIDRIKNISQKSSNILINVPTSYDVKEEKVKKVLLDAISLIVNETEADEESAYLGIDSFGDSAVNYLISIHCPQDKKFDIKRKSLSIIKKLYDDNNIKIPYNQLEVHNAK